MSLMEHLFELRNRLMIAFIALGIGGVIGFVWWSVAPFGLPTLGDLLLGPYCQLPASVRLSAGGGQCQLLQTTPFEPFNIRMKVGLAAGVLLSAPVWLHQIWAFVTPGLHSHERRYALTFVGLASLLFVVGAVLAWFVVPNALSFLVSIGDGQFITALSGDKYIGFVLLVMFIFGVSFELPLLIVMLNFVGVVSFAQLKSWQRGSIFGLCVFAAVATPGQDPISMLALFVAMVLLFEIAVLITYLHDRSVAKRRAALGWDDLDPDEAAPLQHEVEPVSTPRAYDETSSPVTVASAPASPAAPSPGSTSKRGGRHRATRRGRDAAPGTNGENTQRP